MNRNRGNQLWLALGVLPLVVVCALVVLSAGLETTGWLVLSILALLIASRKWARGHMLAVATFAVLGVSVWLGISWDEPACFLVGLLSLMVGLTVLAKRSDASMETFSPFMLVLVAFVAFFGVRPLWLMYEGDATIWALTEALWYVNIGYVMFLIGYELKLGEGLGARLPLPGQDWTPGRMKSAILFCSVLGIVCFLVALRIAGVGSYSQAASEMLELRLKASSGGNAYVIFSMQSALHIAAMLLLIGLLAKPKIRIFPALRFLAFAFLVSAMFWPFAMRGMFLFFLGGIGVMFHFLKRRIKTFEFAVGGLLLAVFIAGYGHYRHITGGYQTREQAVEDLSRVNVATSVMARFDAMDKFAMALEQFRWSPVKHDPTSFFAGILLRPVPRAFLPTKELESGSEMTSRLFPEIHEAKVNFEFSIFGEMYFYFSIFGIIFGMLLYGIVVRILQAYFEKNYMRRDFQLHYSLIVFSPVGWLLAGFNSGATIAFIFFSIACWLTLWYLNGGKTRKIAIPRMVPGQLSGRAA